MPQLACLENAITFYESSINAVSYLWLFGDGNTSIVRQPSHRYPQKGFYTPTLIVTDTLGCKDTLLAPQPIDIKKPTALFTMSDSVAVCPPLLVNFDANVSIDAITYQWDLGTGNTSILDKPSEIYANRKNYTIQLIATDGFGCRDTAKRSVRVLGYKGGFSYTPLLGCKPLKVDFNATIFNVASILWDFGDGVTQTSTVGTISHTYNTIGKYVPKVIFKDAKGCQASSTGLDSITVDGVVTDFYMDAPCENTSVRFVDTSFSPYSTITTWAWKFPGGIFRSKKDPSVFFGPAGTYTITLKTSNSNGCKDSITKDITIFSSPTVSAGIDTIICLSDSATLYPSGALTYIWSPNSYLSCISCTNPKAGPISKTYYTVVGTDVNGCKDTAEVIVDIKTHVESTVSKGDEICEGDSSILTVLGGDTYIWTPSRGLDDPTAGNPISVPQKIQDTW